MELRSGIEPDWAMAEKRYPEVLRLILEYTDRCDEEGDENSIEYKKLEDKLHSMTGKDMSQFNLWEWWEADGAENLSFDISLPDPEIVEGLTKDEVAEIVKRVSTFELPDNEGESFKSLFHSRICFGNGYYQQFLKLNCKGYDIKLFQAHKDKEGNYFEYSQEEIINQLWK